MYFYCCLVLFFCIFLVLTLSKGFEHPQPKAINLSSTTAPVCLLTFFSELIRREKLFFSRPAWHSAVSLSVALTVLGEQNAQRSKSPERLCS